MRDASRRSTHATLSGRGSLGQGNTLNKTARDTLGDNEVRGETQGR